MINYLTQFLKALEAAVPPASGGRHALTYAAYVPEYGTRDRLALLMWVETPHGPRSLTLYFEDEDFNKPVTVLVSECMLFAMRAVAECQPPALEA